MKDKSESKVLDEEYDPNYEPSQEEILEYAEFLGMDLEKDKDLFWIAVESLKAPLPLGWKPCQSPDGVVYYFNFQTGESVWDHPCDEIYKKKFIEEKAKKESKLKQSVQSKTGKSEEDDDWDAVESLKSVLEPEKREETKTTTPKNNLVPLIEKTQLPSLGKKLEPISNPVPVKTTKENIAVLTTTKSKDSINSFDSLDLTKKDIKQKEKAVPVQITAPTPVEKASLDKQLKPIINNPSVRDEFDSSSHSISGTGQKKIKHVTIKEDKDESVEDDFPMIENEETKPVKEESKSEAKDLEIKLMAKSADLLMDYNRKLIQIQEEQEQEFQTKQGLMISSFTKTLERLQDCANEAIETEINLLKNNLKIDLDSDKKVVVKMPKEVVIDYPAINFSLKSLRIGFESSLKKSIGELAEVYFKAQTEFENETKNNFEIELKTKQDKEFKEINANFESKRSRMEIELERELIDLANEHEAKIEMEKQKYIALIDDIHQRLENKLKNEKEDLENIEVEMAAKLAETQKEWDLKLENLKKTNEEKKRQLEQLEATKANAIEYKQDSDNKERQEIFMEWESKLRSREDQILERESKVREKEKQMNDLKVIKLEKESLEKEVLELEKLKISLKEDIKLAQVEKNEIKQRVEEESQLEEQAKLNIKKLMIELELLNTQKKQGELEKVQSDIFKSVPLKQPKPVSHLDTESHDLDDSSSDGTSRTPSLSLKELKKRLKDEEKAYNETKLYLMSERKELEHQHLIALQEKTTEFTKKPVETTDKPQSPIISNIKDGIKDLDSKKQSLDCIEQDLDNLLKTLTKVKEKSGLGGGRYGETKIGSQSGTSRSHNFVYSSSLSPQPSKGGLDIQSPLSFEDQVQLGMPPSFISKYERVRGNAWEACQKRSLAVAHEHQQWLREFQKRSMEI